VCWQRCRHVVYTRLLLCTSFRVQDRYGLIQKEVFAPRQEEKAFISKMVSRQQPQERK
jgi:hypothetical protein